MANKKVTPGKVQKSTKVKLNVNYVQFIGKLMRQKLIELNPQKLRTMYLADVKVKSYRNIARVSERIKRAKLASALDAVLKELGLNKVEFIEASDKVRDKIREKKASSYVEV